MFKTTLTILTLPILLFVAPADIQSGNSGANKAPAKQGESGTPSKADCEQRQHHVACGCESAKWKRRHSNNVADVAFRRGPEFFLSGVGFQRRATRTTTGLDATSADPQSCSRTSCCVSGVPKATRHRKNAFG